MNEQPNPGAVFRAALGMESPLQIVGVINALCAKLAEQAGFRALYLSGAGVANADFGLPDLALTTLTEVAASARRIAAATPLPVLVDADTGWGGPLMVERCVRELEHAGAAGIHLEDQILSKRCGHRPGKVLVPIKTMVANITAACQARRQRDFFLMARTDACAVEGLAAAIARANQYVEAGADAIFAEALVSLDDYRQFTAAVSAPVLANLTEFGHTPLLALEELHAAGVAMALYPLTAFRAMNAAAAQVFATIRREGNQRHMLQNMQTRAELYELLSYNHWEAKLDEVYAPGETE